MQARPWFCCYFCQYLSHKLCNLVFIQKGTLELHNLDHKLPFDTSFGLVGQHLLPSKTDLSAVLLRTAHTITMGAFPVISHYNVYPLSRRKYRKRYPGAKIYGCWGLFWYVARCVWRKGSTVKVESKCSVYCARWDYPPFWRCLRFVWCSLSQPAPPEDRTESLSPSCATISAKCSSCLAFGMSVVQALGSLMSRLKYSPLARCFGGCMP